MSDILEMIVSDMPEVIVRVVQQPVNRIQIVISVCSLVTSIVAIIIAIITYKSQVRHNKNSVKPILNIVVGDYEDDLYVKIVNNGVGPALINKTLCVNKRYKQEDFCLIQNSRLIQDPCLVHLIPHSVKFRDSFVVLSHFTDFVENIEGRTIPPGDSITLLELSGKREKYNALRAILKDVTVTVHYSDVYNDKQPTTERALDFFGRTLSDSDDYEIYFS